MADVIAELQRGARRRKSSLRDTESRQEEEGGKQNAGILKPVETSTVIKFLKRCYNFSTLICKFLLAGVILCLLFNLFSTLAVKTVTSERLGLLPNRSIKNDTEK